MRRQPAYSIRAKGTAVPQSKAGYMAAIFTCSSQTKETALQTGERPYMFVAVAEVQHRGHKTIFGGALVHLMRTLPVPLHPQSLVGHDPQTVHCPRAPLVCRALEPASRALVILRHA